MSWWEQRDNPSVELLALTLERSSIGSDSSKVRRGGVGGHAQELSPEIAVAIDAAWTKYATPTEQAKDAKLTRRASAD